MIEQHIYIKTELGLETYAKSKGLSESYIESTIRPFYSPVDIYYLDEKDFPGLKCVSPLSDGGLLIGNGVKSSSEPGSFIHSLIVSPKDIDAFISDASFFISSPPENISKNPLLPSLEAVSQPKKASDFRSLLSCLKITEGEYMSMLAAAFESIEQKRSVFIAIDTKSKMEDISRLALRLYSDLPFYLRKNTGYLTLFGEVNIRPEINIYFLPPGRLNISRGVCYVDSYNASRDYIFDTENKRFMHAEDLSEDLSGEYLSFIHSCLKSGASPDAFFAFAEEAGQNLSHERRLSLRFYDDLSYIYNIRENSASLPSKLGRTTVIFTELLKSGAGETVFSLYSEFVRIYRRLIKGRQTPIPLDILRRFILNYDFCPDKQKDELYDLLTLDIELCMKESGDENVFSHINAMGSSAELYNKIIENKMMPGSRLIKRYFTYMLGQKRTVHALMEYADSVYSDMPQLIDNELLASMIKDKAVELYDSSGDRLEAVKYLEGKCNELKEKYPENAALFSSVYGYALECYMTSLNPALVTLSQLERFPLADAEKISPECALKHRTVLAAKEIMALIDDIALSFVSYDAFGFENIGAKLSDNPSESKLAEDNLKAVLKRALPEKKSSPKRMLYIIAYYANTNLSLPGRVDFDSIFSFIARILDCPPFEFIEWYLSGDLFMTPILENGRIVRTVSQKKPDTSELSAFYTAAEKYFSAHGKCLATDRGTKKLKKALDRVSALHPDYRTLTLSFRKTLNSIVRENYSHARRIFTRIISAKNFKFAAFLLSCLLLIFGGLAIGGAVASRFGNGVLTTKNYADSEILATDRLGWSAYKLKNDGDYIPAAYCIDGKDTYELFDFERDSKIVISFGTETGITIDGISVSAVLSDENSGFSVYVTDDKNRRLSVGVSDYDIASGSSIYSFSTPMSIKNIIICSREKNEKGSAKIKEVNAYIAK